MFNIRRRYRHFLIWPWYKAFPCFVFVFCSPISPVTYHISDKIACWKGILGVSGFSPLGFIIVDHSIYLPTLFVTVVDNSLSCEHISGDSVDGI